MTEEIAKLLKDLSEELKLWAESLEWAKDRSRAKRMIAILDKIRSTMSIEGWHPL